MLWVACGPASRFGHSQCSTGRPTIDNYFAQVPNNPESIVALVVREAEDKWQNQHLPPLMLDHCAREAVVGLWGSQIKTFVPLLALRRVRSCVRAGTCDCEDW